MSDIDEICKEYVRLRAKYIECVSKGDYGAECLILTSAMRKIHERLTEIESATGRYSRPVGNYKIPSLP